MNTRLEEKLLEFKAMAYAKKINGIDNFSLFPLPDNSFQWHKENLSKIMLIDRKLNETLILDHPIKKENFIELCINEFRLDDSLKCSSFFEDRYRIYFNVNNSYLFLSSVIDIGYTYDFSLSFTCPDRLIVACDEEYCISLFDLWGK